MPTRYAKEGGELKQDRFSSSFDRGLLANLVAKRCSVLADPLAISVIWFLQLMSWQPGGLSKVVEELRVALGQRPLEPAEHAGVLRWLQVQCLDPNSDISSQIPAWSCSGLAIARYRDQRIKRASASFKSSLGRKVSEALDFTRSAQCLTIINGQSRLGKSFAAKVWCDESAGLARYVQVPCTNDDISFFREIARAMGVSSSLQLKAAEIKARVEDTLHASNLMLLLDEAHYLWPQNWQRYAMPGRVNWIMTALVNWNIPVALVTTPQFYSGQSQVERLTRWNSEQFVGRIGHVESLPSRLEPEDVLAIARAMLPECSEKALRALAKFAEQSRTNLGCLDAIARRARWFATRDGRSQVSDQDIRQVMRERIATFDNPMPRPKQADRERKAGLQRDVRRVPADAARRFGDGRAYPPDLGCDPVQVLSEMD